MQDLQLPIRAARETAVSHGVIPDRCDVLQNGSTLVLRLTDTLVARVIRDVDGPRKGTTWFERENAVAMHLAERGAPVIPLHPSLPPGPHEHLGHALNFWQFVTTIDAVPDPATVGKALYHCHDLLRSFKGSLQELAILGETRLLLETLEEREHFTAEILDLLKERIEVTALALREFPFQPLHGDAHPGNLMNTTQGLLWTDWEDTFLGPVEWDLASAIWNARILDQDHATADLILEAYRAAGGQIIPEALRLCLVARAAVMSAWYPVLYPNAGVERTRKLEFRLDWLRRNH